MSYFYSEQLPNVKSTDQVVNSHVKSSLRFSDKPFLARADYISADYIKNNPHRGELDFLNYVRLEIEIPYLEGTLPLISTQPLQEAQNLRYLLSLNDSGTSSSHMMARNHVCSNFVNHSLVKYGFLKADEFDFDSILDDDSSGSKSWTQLYTRLNSHRSPQTLSFYSSLDANHCSWHYVAYYDITELTAHCAAQLISPDLDSSSSDTHVNKSSTSNAAKTLDSTDKSYLIIKIPLYVSYLYAGQQGAWTSVDYKSSVEASIIYKTKSLYGAKSDDKALNLNELLSLNVDSSSSSSLFNVYDSLNVEKNDHLMSLTVSKISMTDQGKLVIEFSTIAAFHGQFVKMHPGLVNQESRLLAPSGMLGNVEFGLELVWSQYTYDYPEQTWKATSNSIINVRLDVMIFFLNF